jgi:hypothetical protein
VAAEEGGTPGVAEVTAAAGGVGLSAAGLAGVKTGLRSLPAGGASSSDGLSCALSTGSAAGRADPPFGWPTVSAGSGAASAATSVVS